MTPAPYTIRPARPDEHAALESLQWRVSLANENDRAALLAHPEVVTTPIEQLTNGHAFVAATETTLLGFAAAIPREDGDFELDALFVDPNLWRSGIGRGLLKACITHAGSHGATTLHVIGNPHACAFYDSTGFQTTGTVQTQFGFGYLMVLPLNETVATDGPAK